jgi:hypothetical protein
MTTGPEASIDCRAAIEILQKHGARNIAMCSAFRNRALLSAYLDLGFAAVVPDQDAASGLKPSPQRIYDLSAVPAEIDGLVVIDAEEFPALMRRVEPLARRGCLILPALSDWVVPRSLREGDAMYTAWNTTAAANYVARCNLKGHYLEFGAFWGRSFFPNYFRFRHWLRGSFFAWDSFRGLSTPHPDETHFTGGDFQDGAYCSNERSFAALADLVGMPQERLSIVPGFFENTLQGRSPSTYNLEAGSVSVCYIDCDLKEPTAQVLKFVGPLLEPGALLYFDDWRLCRGSRLVGERAAALEWLGSNPGIELVEFDRATWQDQWFIFQRR